ncbi:MAG: S9 family peptidase [Planctomycetes bacterium]|nr:S9 family peptidase [Planctomycetota bacterium]
MTTLQLLPVLFACSVGFCAPFAAAQGTQTLTYADTQKQISWEGRGPSAQWAADGVHLELFDGKTPMWLLPATGAMTAPPKDAPQQAGAATALRKVVLVNEGDLWIDEVASRGANSGGRRSPRAFPAGSGRLSDKAVQLTKTGDKAGRKEEAQLSPDGLAASFVRGNNLVVVDVTTQQEWAVTTDGGPELFHGMLDWVYQEEIYGRGNFQGHWWNPNGGQLAFLSLDESAVREFTIVDHVPHGFLDTERTVATEVSNYPKSGDPNPFARMSIARIADHRIVPVDLSAFPKDVLVMRVEWTPDGKTLLLSLQDRIQTWAELCAVDPETGALTKWIREDSKTWVNRTESPRWLADGTFLWMSERTGYAHVYHYAPGGKLLGPITSGDWQVRSIERLDEAQGLLWFEGTKDGATGRHLYRTSLRGGDPVCLTPGIGTHRFELDAAGTFVLDRWSAMDMPTKVRVLDGTTGNVVKDLGQATKGEAEKYAFTDRQRVTIKARDGYELDASVQLPFGWQAGGSYPVFLPTYSGPDVPTVRDNWSHTTYHQFLAQQGFVILQVNVRSASNRGQQDTGACYQNLGAQELKDLEDAVDHVCKHFAGDPARIAISGWSYGGFMAAYALTHSKKFALGLAGAGVYDWRLYDTVYTERYMRTPQENKAGYDASSVIKAAKNLHGHLVLLHGTKDDNVHMQNTMQLLWELQSAGKQNFELMLYPRSRHGLAREVNRHSQELQWLRLQKLLAPAKKAGSGQ